MYLKNVEKPQDKFELFSVLDNASQGVLKIKVIGSQFLEGNCNLAVPFRNPEVFLAWI